MIASCFKQHQLYSLFRTERDQNKVGEFDDQSKSFTNVTSMLKKCERESRIYFSDICFTCYYIVYIALAVFYLIS